jgi:hypothetical protein
VGWEEGSRIGRCGWITSFLEHSWPSVSATYRLFLQTVTSFVVLASGQLN